MAYTGNQGSKKVGGFYGFAYGQWQTKNNPGQFKGTYNTFVGDLGQIHRRQQQQFQDQVVANIKSKILRRGASTGRLVEVTADSRNRLIGGTGANPSALSGGQGAQYGWGVGNPKFLDVSIAKYWRTIEEGSAAVWKHPFVTGPEGLQTKSGDPLWGWFGAGAFRGGSGALASGPYTAPQSGLLNGKFRPFYAEKPNGKRAFPKREHGLIIEHEIAPMHAYLDAWRSVEKDVFKGWEQAWQATFGRGVPGNKERFLNTPNIGGHFSGRGY